MTSHANPFSSENPNINNNLADLPSDATSEDIYIASKLPDMRIDKRGRIWRANPRIMTSFPAMTQEEWERIMR